jgi:hypothetical protein
MSFLNPLEQDLRMTFANGWGVSIQRSPFHKCNGDTYEVAVMHKVGAETDTRVCSNQGIAPDGIDVWMTPNAVVTFIDMVIAMRPVEYCTHKRREE